MKRLLAICLALFAPALQAQPGTYSQSAEYQAMLQELQSPSPSPIFLSTGRRPTADPSLSPKVRKQRSSVQIETPQLRITLDAAAATATFLNLETRASWMLTFASAGTPQPALKGSSAAVTRQQNTWTLSSPKPSDQITIELLRPAMVRISLTGEAVLHVGGSDPCFGLGERFAQASLAGVHFDVRPADRSGEPGHNWSYVAVPLVYTPSGLGLYADTIFDTNFAFNAAGSAFDLRVAHSPVTLYVLAGDGPKSILEQYTGLTGRPKNPPLWTFGPWINALQGKDAVLAMAQRIRTEGIPASALWVFDELDEPNNLGWPFWYSSYYGDPRAFNDTLHDLGFKVLGYVHPYVRERMLPYPTPSPAYAKGVTEKLLVVGADGLPHGPEFEPVRTGNLDFTNPRTVDWWQTMLTHAVRDQRWDGWMEDFGEYVADSDQLAAGNGARLSEVYPLLYHKITTQIVQALNPGVVSFSRSGFTGTQQWSPMLWGGDQQHDWLRDLGLPSVVTAGITAGMSGYSTWGPDILSDGPDRELWMRWAEFAALTPVMRDHVWSKPEFSVNLWHDPQTIALFRKYARLHSSLLPYFATYAEQASRSGVPILRHLVLEYPHDPRSAQAEYEYLLGESILVAPVIEQGAVQRTLYLPPGTWQDYWTGERYTGGADVTVPAPLDRIPLLIRAGAILPAKPEDETPTLPWGDPQVLEGPLVWKAYPEKTAGKATARTFTLPDGTSATLETSADAVTVTGSSPKQRRYEIVIAMDTEPASVQLDQQTLSRQSWRYDPAAHQLHALFTATAFRLVVPLR